MTRASALKEATKDAVAGAGSTAVGTPPLRDAGGKSRRSHACRQDVVELVTMEGKNNGIYDMNVSGTANHPPRATTLVRTSAADDLEVVENGSAERASAAKRSTWVSVGANLLLTGAQISAGLVSGSQGLIADGIHSLSDLLADFVVLLASHHSRKDADVDHPYGHYRYETAASLVLGVLLVAVGAGMLWSASIKLERPGGVAAVQSTALWVVGGALIVKELLFRYMLAVARRVKSTLLTANAWHARSDAASSLVVGLGIVGNLSGFPVLDPIAALIVGFMVARMGWVFGWDALHDLMDRSADEEETAAILRTLLETPGVGGVHDVRTRKMGDMLVVDAHLDVNAALSVEAGHNIAVEARTRVLGRHRVLNVMTHVDPLRESAQNRP